MQRATFDLVLLGAVLRMLGKPAFDHFVEKYAERALHHVFHHHIPYLLRLRMLPDVLIIGLLILLDVALRACGLGEHGE